MPRFRTISRVEVEAVQWRIGGQPLRTLLAMTQGTDVRACLELSDQQVLFAHRNGEKQLLLEGDWIVLHGKKLSIVPNSMFTTMYESVVGP